MRPFRLHYRAVIMSQLGRSEPEAGQERASPMELTRLTGVTPPEVQSCPNIPLSDV